MELLMQRRARLIWALSILLCSAGWAARALACGQSDVCSDVSQSLVGQLDIDTVTVSWSTDDEDSTIGSYKVFRYDCETPNTCMVSVTTVTAVGSCGSTEDYSIEDDPPSPAGDWTYVVEVWTSASVRACAVDVVPE